MVAGMAMMSLGQAAQRFELSDTPNGVTLLQQDEDGLTLKLQIGEVGFENIITKEGSFNLMVAPGLTSSHRIGEPSLPMAVKLLAIPAGCELEVRVVSSEIEELDLSGLEYLDPLMPVQPSLSKSDDPMSAPFEYNRELYEQPGFYTMPIVESEISGAMRGLRLGKVIMAPVEYNPTENVVRVYKELTVEVSFRGADWQATRDNYVKHYSPFFEPIYERVMNYDQPMYDLDHPDLVKYPVKYLIISDRMFEAQLQPFIEWKTRKGFTVQVAYTDVIGSNHTVIASYIEGVYNAGTPEDPAPSFVLLAGDAQQMDPFSGTAGSHVTDLYFCEFTNDIFPEIYYGRFSAQNTTQMQPQIDKTLEYEQYLMPDPSYLAEVTLVSGVDGTYAITHGNGQINYGTNLYFNAAHGISPNVWLYPASDASGAAAAIIQTVSDGIGLYNYTAHCSHSGHADPSFTTADIPGLTNYHKYLLGIGNCCLPNTFDESTPCFGEAFLQVADKGGIGYVGATNSTYWNEDYWWGVGYGAVVGSGPAYEATGLGAYDGLFHDHGEPVEEHYITNHAINFAGNLAVTESNSSLENYYWEAYHLMGDPSVTTYLGVPAVNNVVHEDAILMTMTAMTVQADPGSYIGVTFDGELVGQAYVDESGTVDVPLATFTMPGEAEIVVTGQNKIPYTAVIQVITPSGPYVIFDGYDVNDAVGGNGNGLVDNGESISLGLQLKNVGPDDALDVVANVTSTNQYVNITDGTESYGTIAGNNGTGYVADAISFDALANIPDGERIQFDLEVTGTNRDAWYGSFSITAHAPELAYVSVYINDAVGGDNNGVLDPGESADLVVTLGNGGSGQAFNISAILGESDQYTTVDDDYGYFGDIDSADGSANNAGDVFAVTADSACPLGYGVPMTLDVSGANFSAVLVFNVTVGDRVVFYFDDFSYDQGWTGLGGSAEWQMGSPLGNGGDPSQDVTPTSDNAVLGNDLSGEYNSGISGTQWVYSPLVDCGSMFGVIMTYHHWLGVESSSYDHAYLEVYNGGGWVRLFENGATMQETSWQLEEYDLSAVADSNPNFQIRFGLGGTDGSVQASGWNIDDIEVRGYGRVGVPQCEIATAQITDSLQPGDDGAHFVRVHNLGDGTLRMWFTSACGWLEFSNQQQIILPGDSVDLDVIIHTGGIPYGDNVGALNWFSNEHGDSTGSIPVFVHVYTPDIQVVETSISEAVEAGTEMIYPLVVTNNGPGRLDFTVGCQMDQNKSGRGGIVAAQVTRPDPIGHRPADADKSGETEPFYPALSKGFGGPDVYGHNWIDSDEPAGPTYSWVDIATVGASVTLLDDDATDAIPIGFGFPLYDSVYTELYIGSNGIVAFDSASIARVNHQLPDTTMTAFIAMWWDDIDPRKGGAIYYHYDAANGRFIVSFNEVKLYYSSTGAGSLSFQVSLYSDGTIELQYGLMDPGSLTLQSGTIGIQNSDATDGLGILYNAPYMHNNLAITINADHWLYVDPRGGSIDPFSNATLDIHLDATEVEGGICTGSVFISSNDPDTPTHSIAISMNVGGATVCGDVDGDGGGPNIADLVYLVDYMFNDGPPPPDMAAADLNGEPGINIGDLVYLADFMFNSGPPPTCQ